MSPEQYETLHWRLRDVENRLQAAEIRFERIDTPISPPFWTERNLTEPQVQYALEDLCESNQCVYDIGANFGGLSLTMSRAVGPRGVVCAFEANPEIARLCQNNLNRWGCFNAQIYNNAVYSKSGLQLDLYLSSNMVSDSLVYKVSDRTVKVDTVSMDSFIDRSQLKPALIKMDIEGAEYEALLGMKTYIEAAHPTFILEQRPEDDLCFELLKESGYKAVDLRSYRFLNKMSDLPNGTIVTDILYMTPEALAETPYGNAGAGELIAELTTEDFIWESATYYATREPLYLAPGRYLAACDFEAKSPSIECKVGVSEAGAAIMRYHGTSGWLAQAGRNWVFDLNVRTPVTAFCEFPGGRDESFQLESLTIHKLLGFPMKPNR